MSTPPSVLLFDLGGVLVKNVGFDRLNELLPSPLPIEDLKTKWLSSPAVRSFEVGSSTPEAFAGSVVAEWQLALSPSAFLAAFTSWPQGLYPGASELLGSLRKRYTVACLSNSNEVHWQRFNGFSEHFEIALSSHLLGEVKPDSECFIKALRECNASAGDVAFFDDSLTNVVSARELGIEALHVNGLSEVRSSLAERGWHQ